MKKIFFISFLLLFTALPLSIVLDKEQKGNEMMTGGFGTQYADSPYPFGNPSAPVRCRLKLYRKKFIIIQVQQDQTALKIPTDAMRFEGARKRADSERCEPIDISLGYIYSEGELLRYHSKGYPSQADEAGYVGLVPVSQQKIIEIRVIDLLPSSVNAKAAAEKLKSQTDLKRYTPQLKMQHYPLWFYPNAKYVEYEKNNGLWPPFDKYGYGVMNSKNPLTNQPYVVECRLSVEMPENISDNTDLRERFVQAKLSNGGYGYCEGLYYIVTDNTVLTLEVKIFGDAVPFIDQIYAKIDNTIRDYIVPTSSETLKTIN